MPEFGWLSVSVVTSTGSPKGSVDPVMVTEMPVVELWFEISPPLIPPRPICDSPTPTAMTPAALAMLRENVPVLGLLLASPE